MTSIRVDATPRMMTDRSVGSPLAPDALPTNVLGAREVRVSVRAASVNPVDWKLRDVVGLRLVHGLLGPKGRFVCGIDFAGVVTEVGPAARGVSVGDPVVGAVDFGRRQRGAYASEVVVRDVQVAVLPAHVDLYAAACLPTAGATAHKALFDRGGLGAIRGGNVLVLGASGGVGHLAVQLARNHGARVVGVSSSRNTPLVARLGATPIAHDEGDVFERAAALGPFDVVVNGVDTVRYPIARVARLLTAHGRHVLLAPRPLDFASLVRPSISTLVVLPTRQVLEPLVRALADGTLEVVISGRFRLDDAEQAQQRSRAGNVVGKIVLEV